MVVWIEIVKARWKSRHDFVTTCVVVWIEIYFSQLISVSSLVTTCVVVWIEIRQVYLDAFFSQSPPAWWCGLKYTYIDNWFT